MDWRKLLIIMGLIMAVAALSWVGQSSAQTLQVGSNGYYIPNYFGTTPNWANSPPLTKFVDTLPGLNSGAANNLGQYIPVAIPDTTTFPATATSPGSDYYVIELGEFTKQMHTNLPPTRLRGYRQLNTTDTTVSQFQYLGPLIIAQKDRPVRILFVNNLPTGTPGNLFLPVDTTVMGSGPFEINYNPETKEPIDPVSGNFAQNRATLHLHGGRTPWISDGTAHQWVTPPGETAVYPKGVSVAYVPDMWFNSATGAHITACAGQTTCAQPNATNNPGPGRQTFFWTNQQSARLLFYHDHAWGITRLNVYAGMAAGYLIQDPVELAMVAGGTVNGRTYNAGTIPSVQIPLVIQDKTFVDGNPSSPTYVMSTDPTWAWGSNPAKPVTTNPQTGDLWWPHVYMPAQNPYNPDMSGVNPMGRWMYGPWFFPPTPTCGSTSDAVPPFCIQNGPVPNPYFDPIVSPSPEMPGTLNPSWGAEGFMDTMLVNGTAYPKLTLQPQAYRFRILSAGNDRFLNLQLYVAANKTGPTTPGAGVPVFTGPVSDLTEVAMVFAAATSGFPTLWPTDGREGGVPDPATRGPAFIQIGTEGGFLPAPVVLPNQPVAWNRNPTLFNAGNVLQQSEGGGTLFLGPAERADVIVDFTNFAGKTLILYNDAPTAFPALDPHYDYYTGAPDRRAEMGGAAAVLPGMGPNNRTIMQIEVTGTGGTAPADDYNPTTLANLQAAFASGATPGAFASSQEQIIVGQADYGTGTGNTSAYNVAFPANWPEWGISRISDSAISFRKVDGTLVSKFPMKTKAMHDEMGATFDEYGRMAAKLGLERPFTNAAIANFVLQNFVDPATEIVAPGAIQIWKITHNGVDTHPIHFHLFDVQVLNRVAWDGFIRLPDPNELGFKDTIRISPLEDTIVALRPVLPRVPFPQPNSIRPLHPAKLLGSRDGFSQIDPLTGNGAVPPVDNQLANFGHEYTWHCHILSHEENDMMRPVILNPNAASAILWRNIATGSNAVWNMDASSLIGISNLPALPNTNYVMVGTGDFNGDGKPDIVWRNTATGANAIWNMDGTTLLSITDLPWLPNTEYALVGVGDFNGDGKPDIFWRNTTTGANAVWNMNGATLLGITDLPGLPNPDYTVVGVGDFNGDGKPDLLWRNGVTGANAIWYMNGVTLSSIADLPAEVNPNWIVSGVGDLNNDVYPDILWRNTSTGEVRVWYLKEATFLKEGYLPPVPNLEWEIEGS